MREDSFDRQGPVRPQQRTAGARSALPAIIADPQLHNIDEPAPRPRPEQIRVRARDYAEMLDLVARYVTRQNVEIARGMGRHHDIAGAGVPLRGLPVDDVINGALLVGC